jgi:hypothetical protein
MESIEEHKEDSIPAQSQRLTYNQITFLQSLSRMFRDQSQLMMQHAQVLDSLCVPTMNQSSVTPFHPSHESVLPLPLSLAPPPLADPSFQLDPYVLPDFTGTSLPPLETQTTLPDPVSTQEIRAINKRLKTVTHRKHSEVKKMKSMDEFPNSVEEV